MNYIAFLRMSPEVVDRALEVDKKRKEERRAVKTIFPSQVVANTSDGILELIIFESEDALEIAEYVQAYTSVGCKMEVYPIWPSSEGFKIWRKIRE